MGVLGVKKITRIFGSMMSIDYLSVKY